MKKAEVEQRILEGKPIWFMPNIRTYGPDAECRRGEYKWWGQAIPVGVQKRSVMVKGFDHNGKKVELVVALSKVSCEIPKVIQKGYLDDWWMYEVRLEGQR